MLTVLVLSFVGFCAGWWRGVAWERSRRLDECDVCKAWAHSDLCGSCSVLAEYERGW